MNIPNSRTSRVAVASATPIAVLVAAGLIWQSSNAAFTETTRNSGNNWSAGTVTLTDDDAGSARFQATNMVPGATETKCIAVLVDTDVPGVVKGYAVNAQPSAHGLENHILVDIEAGTGGGFGSCTGFTSEETIVTGATLGQFAAIDDYASGIGGWTVGAGTDTRTYRITWTFSTTGMTQDEINQLQGDQTGIDMQWELQSS